MPGVPHPADIAGGAGEPAGPPEDKLAAPARNGGDPAPAGSEAPGQTPVAGLARASWSLASIAFAVAALILLMEGYYGYASVTFAVAAAAGINLT